MKLKIEKSGKDDFIGLKEILNSTGLFPPEMLEEMMRAYFEDSDSGEIWFSALLDNEVVGFAYCAPEKFCDGTYNLLAIGIDPEKQGHGIGNKLIKHLEKSLQSAGARLLMVESSGSPDYDLSRRFYQRQNFELVATIADYWQEGEDKVIFTKKI
ncbi:MAG: GNAT family N-acetyltransferase [Bacteroidetes bacterium]|nr:GNAT family N-acetyltransferase [Bacteroidota bacterium]